MWLLMRVFIQEKAVMKRNLGYLCSTLCPKKYAPMQLTCKCSHIFYNESCNYYDYATFINGKRVARRCLGGMENV